MGIPVKYCGPAFQMLKFLWSAVSLDDLDCPMVVGILQSKCQSPSVMRQPKPVSTSPLAQAEAFLLEGEKKLERCGLSQE